MAKRRNGAGSIYQREDGRWIAATTIDGKRRVVSAKTKREVEVKLRELRRQPVSKPVKQSLTFAEWCDTWLVMKEPVLRPSTIRDYRLAVGMLVPALGDTRLDALTPLQLSQVFTRLDHGKRQTQRAYTVLHGCLEAAVRMQVLAENPLSRVPKPAWKPRDKSYWTLDQYRLFLDTALSSSRRHAALFAFVALTGLRESEALALVQDDLDLAAGTVKVTKALVCVDGVYHLMPPKSKAGYRIVSLPDMAVRALSSLPRSWEHVFYPGEPPYRWDIRRYLKALCCEAEVPYIACHDLRHVAATTAIRATHDIHAVSRRLGHSNVNVTMGIYAYALVSDDNVAGALDKLLSAGG